MENYRFVWLPTNSPRLNPIENEFSIMQRVAIDNSRFDNTKQVKHAVYKYIKYRNSQLSVGQRPTGKD